eukprot:TRINITY_DN8464_c0_g1_i1.p3 TRINITY_DN8464_c0_g1~~TRINITY_DN8464_c0_g1_i1.p3  ORF type:complete len:119 (+),score=7.22 TRINITY_DN8464_c0_g1_i1:350-706(+)
MYPYPVIAVEESRELVDYAENVMDQPFRPKTYPRILVCMVSDNVSETDEEHSDKQSDKFKIIQVKPKQPVTTSQQEGTTNRFTDNNIQADYLAKQSIVKKNYRVYVNNFYLENFRLRL